MNTHGDTSDLGASLRPLLRTEAWGHAYRYYGSVSSTNDVAAAWAQAGAPEGAVVGADYQEHGRGRLGRHWAGEPGQNLMCSVILRPRLGAATLSLLPLAAALGMVEGLSRWVDASRLQIKWPNDVLLDGAKVCGILTEATWRGDAEAQEVVLGWGLNVNQAAFPSGLAAISLRCALGHWVDRAPLWADLLAAQEQRYLGLHTDAGPQALQAAYEPWLWQRGARVRLYTAEGGPLVEGRLVGVDSGGALRLATDVGLRTFHAAEVSFRDQPASR
ncbi:MAG: biotin--[acetyl-CoA-carboxylase] ligase [Bacteroidota bacterium]